MYEDLELRNLNDICKRDRFGLYKQWIYDNCKLGTKVEFYSSSNPGPLGKPTARKISSAPSNVRGWDPTDPARGNPWKNLIDAI